MLQLKLFGSPQIHYQGQALTGFVSAKVRALLIYLAVTGRPHSRDHLAELLWADTPASTRANLRKALSNLRQLIGNTLVEDAKESIALNGAQVWVDVVEFGRLIKGGADQEAVTLYQADFLTGFNLSLSYEFEAWALSEQSRLKTQMVDLLRHLATQQEANSKRSEAISTVRRLLNLEPWHEEHHRWLMALLAKDGQRSAALAHFEVCKRVLWDELAVEPSGETLQLVERIQRANETSIKPRPKPTAIPKPEFPLIGRETELQIIQQAWQRCVQDGAHFVSIAGEAGIGKTRLTQEARIWVEAQGYATFYARSYAAEGALAYSPVVDWLRSEPIRSSLDQLDTVWLNELVRLLPELLKSNPQLSPPKPIADAMQRRLLFEAIARAILVIEKPLLLVIDDLQWCDGETLEWLRFLLRFDSSRPLLVVGGFRVEEVNQDHGVYELIGSLRKSEQVTEFELTALNAQDTRKLFDLVAHEPMTTSQGMSLYQKTSGHPLFAIESVRTQNTNPNGGSSGKSSKVQNVIQTRLSLLSVETRQLVELAATIGRSFSFRLLQRASKQDESTLYQRLEELWQRRVIVDSGLAQFDFSHDRIRESVYAGISPVILQRLHQQIAEAIEELYREDLSEWDAQIAIHYQIAGKSVNALHYFVKAVQTLSSRWALDEALAIVNRALLLADNLPKTEANQHNRLKLLTFQYDIIIDTKGGTAPQLREIAEQALWLSEKLNDHTHNFIARTWLRMYHVFRAERIQAKAISEANLAFAQKTEDPMLLWEAYADLGSANFVTGDLINATLSFDRANEVKRTFDSQIPPSDKKQLNCVEFYSHTAQCYYLAGYLEQAEQWATSALAIAESSNNPATFAVGLELNLQFQVFSCRTDTIKKRVAELSSISQKHGFLFSQKWSNLYYGWALAQEGQPEQAINMLKQVIEYFKSNHYLMLHVKRLCMLIEAYRMAHRYQEGLTTVFEALEFANRTSDQIWVPELYRLQGELLFGSGANSTEVEESYQKSLAVSREQCSRLLELRTSVSLARLWLSQGKRDEAYQLLAPIYNWFTEGFDMPDLIEAKKLLDELTVNVPLSH
jgi:DNA-binding SARP family transcriptional activator